MFICAEQQGSALKPAGLSPSVSICGKINFARANQRGLFCCFGVPRPRYSLPPKIPVSLRESNYLSMVAGHKQSHDTARDRK
jgi:hypothetical protein